MRKDVTIAKDGQEAFEKVRESMEQKRLFHLIFMDVQVMNLLWAASQYMQTLQKANLRSDAKLGWTTKYPTHSRDWVHLSHRRIDRFCRRE